MKATELRIGNILKYHDQNVYVLLIDQNSAEFGYFKDSIGFCRFYADDECPQPIPLTEEWLRRLGFDDKEYKKGFIGIDVNHMNFVLTKPHGEYDYECFVWEYKNDIWPKYNEFKFVHELQNFFYALTGSDLTIPVSEKPLSEGA